MISRCEECGRLPVKRRRNGVCMTCDAVVCASCQDSHWDEQHAADDYARMMSVEEA